MITIATSDLDLRELIDDVARYRDLPAWSYRGEHCDPGTFLEGVVLTESSGDRRKTAVRYERHQDKPGRADTSFDQDRPGVDDGPVEDDTSYGLCQVMGYNIKLLTGVTVMVADRRWPDPVRRIDFTPFFDAELNLMLGTRLLCMEIVAVERELLREHRDLAEAAVEIVDRALMRYNGGPSGDDKQDNGTRRLQAYVDKVGRNSLLARASRNEMGWRPWRTA